MLNSALSVDDVFLQERPVEAADMFDLQCGVINSLNQQLLGQWYVLHLLDGHC